jgi:hypothetical protein
MIELVWIKLYGARKIQCLFVGRSAEFGSNQGQEWTQAFTARKDRIVQSLIDRFVPEAALTGKQTGNASSTCL